MTKQTAIIIVLLFSGLLFSPESSPESSPKSKQQHSVKKEEACAMSRAIVTAVALKKAMRNPDSFKLESALIVDGTNAICYEYRAQNGFGGMNFGRAFIYFEGRRFLQSEAGEETEEFITLWNRECANKSG